ncbi:MAG: dihydroorotase [Parvibaculum sp.]|uniref:dihydroorotase n=1 Tax=Parvibaculum sp. TaxID=2024848 RepID=UPI0025F0C351|nr:dihydroorotase [Parvibaculum sp.]MCE9648745.1 dihydroorotase [Parvibaculum sp.]
MSARIAFINARIVDPASGFDGPGALLVEDGKIADIGPRLFNDAKPANAEIIDCGGHVLAPGLIDMRVFTGEPGAEHRETLASAGEAAAAGGVTSFAMMPVTDPVIDDAALVDFILRRAAANAAVRIYPMAALTKGLNGTQMSEMGLLQEAGAIAFTDADRTIASSLIMRRCLTYAANFDALVVAHAEDPALAGAGHMNEGAYAARMGLGGIPSAAETIAVERDIRLVELTGARYHLGQVSCAAALDAIAKAKARGLPVSCSVSAHHLVLNEQDIGEYKTFAKVSPALRAESDREAMVEGVRNGTIDAIVSSHDPQAPETKRLPFAQAAFGAIGLETLLPASLSLHHAAGVALIDVLRHLTIEPANILRLAQGRLAKGAPADLVVFDAAAPRKIDPADFRSRTKNSPFKGRLMQGQVLRTMVAGKTVFQAT